MPEPDINDPDFDQPTTEPVRGSGFGRPVKKRLRGRKKLPVEFAEFRLNDGRALGQLVGPDFFGPPSGSDGGAALPRGVRDRLAENKSPLAGILRDDPRIAPRPEPADEEFTNPLSGPDERDPAAAAVNSPIAGRLPAGIAGGMPGPDMAAPNIDPRAIAGMDDAGLTGLADSRLDFDELTALKPKTYGDSMRYAAAIAKVAGMRKEEVDGLGSLLARDENGMPRDVSGADILPSSARENYERFVTAARARRNIPIDIPLTTDGKIDYSLVQPGFLYKGGRGVVLNVGPDRKSFVEARRRPENVEAAPTKPENGARPAAGKVDPRAIAGMDGPWPDVSSAIAGMDDAGLHVPATRIDKARDTVAALEGVTLPSAVDQVRRDTLKAMVGIHAGEKLPRDYARKARNKAMLDFMAAPPALRESMLADQIGLLMDGISDNGKRAVDAYTALKGKMKGIEAMNLAQLYGLKRRVMEDRDMAGRPRRHFATLVDEAIAVIDKKIEGGAYQGVGPHFSKWEVPYAYGKEAEKYDLNLTDIPDGANGAKYISIRHKIARLRTGIENEVVNIFLRRQVLKGEGNLSEAEIDGILANADLKLKNKANELGVLREQLIQIFATVPMSALEGMKKVPAHGLDMSKKYGPKPQYRNPHAEEAAEATTRPNANSGDSYQEISENVSGELKALVQDSAPGGVLSHVGKSGTYNALPFLDRQLIYTKAHEIDGEIAYIERLKNTHKILVGMTRQRDKPYLSYEMALGSAKQRIEGYIDRIAHLAARHSSSEYKKYLQEDEEYQEDTPFMEQTGSGAARGNAKGDIVTGANRMVDKLGELTEIRDAMEENPDMGDTVTAIMQDKLDVTSEQFLISLDMIAGGIRKRNENPASPSLAFARKALGQSDYDDVLASFARDMAILPEAITEYVARNPVTTVGGAISSIVAALVFPPGLLIELAVAAGGASLDAAVEAYEAYGKEIVAIMIRGGVNFDDQHSVMAFWADETKRQYLLADAAEEWQKSAVSQFLRSMFIGVGVGKTRNILPGDPLYKKLVTAVGQESADFILNYSVDEVSNRPSPYSGTSGRR